MLDGADFDADSKGGAPGPGVAANEPDPFDLAAAESALNEAARRVSAVWIGFIVLCVYIFIATFTVTPAMLFRDAPVKMPIFDADLPLKVYFAMAPVLVLALHAYLIVLTKGLSEKIEAHEDALRRSCRFAAGRNALRGRLDNSIVLRAMSAQYRDARVSVDYANNIVGYLTGFILPIALLLLTQWIFLPYQDQFMTWVHRAFVFADLVVCLWLLWPRTPRLYIARRVFAVALTVLAVAAAIVAAFPGERVYEALARTWAHDITVRYFEGPPDPVDYVHKGGVLPFPNRLILPDDPKLAEIPGAPAGGVSLSVRGRNFRKAVFDRSNLARVDFSAADLAEASLQGAKLEGARFECAVYGTRGSYANDPEELATSPTNLDCAKLERAKLWFATLDGASFRGARMNGAKLESMNVKNADFSEAELLGARFNNVEGSAANFSGALLMGADFQAAQLLAAIFTGAKLQGARMSSAKLPAANFDKAHLQGADLSGANLLAASLQAAKLHDATLVSANIKGATFLSASLRGASLKCVTPFRTLFREPLRQGSAKVDPGSPDAELAQTIVSPPHAKCETGFDYGYSYYDVSYVEFQDKFDKIGDDTRADTGWYDSAYHDSYAPKPEELTPEAFGDLLNKVLTGLPDDESKKRVREAFERLKPGARTKAQDEADKAFWAEWARKSAPRESHDEALAARLEFIACVAEGAPYVARGLLRAGRFDAVPIGAGMDEAEKERIKQVNARNARILDRLHKASDGSDKDCLGAKALDRDEIARRAATK